VKFGKALAAEASLNEMIAIPGLHNRPPKEISVKNLANIIQARMEEIIELVHAEIIYSGYEDKLSAGIVLTGGGAQLQSLQQLFEYMTGKPVRIGHPNQHLGKTRLEAVKSPMYSTAVGLVLSGFRALDDRENKYQEYESTKKTKNVVRKENSGGHMFKAVTARLKDLLADDFGDDNTKY